MALYPPSLNRVKHICQLAKLTHHQETKNQNGKHEIFITGDAIKLIQMISRQCSDIKELSSILDNIIMCPTGIVVENMEKEIFMEEIFNVYDGYYVRGGVHTKKEIENFLYDSAGQLKDGPYTWLSIKLNEKEYPFCCSMVTLYFRAYYCRGNTFTPRLAK